ncbi:hypothetical protein JST97_21430 [bacterium]|nr:hypothetical protein [bacterium]
MYTFTHMDQPQSPAREEKQDRAECLRLLAQRMLNLQWALGDEEPV